MANATRRIGVSIRIEPDQIGPKFSSWSVRSWKLVDRFEPNFQFLAISVPKIHELNFRFGNRSEPNHSIRFDSGGFPNHAQLYRRSGNYKPTLWDDDFLQSITSDYAGKTHSQRAEYLKEEVKNILLEKTNDTLDQIEIINILERLGISYHFTEHIDKILEDLFNMVDELKFKDLNATSLSFRLLRQHGFLVPQEVFAGFMDEKAGKFKNSFQNDVKGLLSLYEASYLSMEGETIMDAARDFAIHNLKEIVKKEENLDKILALEINHTLELPLHWRMLRLEARWFIDVYETMRDMNPILLEFAKLDFNMVQAMYQEELKQLSRWYTDTKLAEKMSFARDRLVESFLWTIGITFEPRFGYCRIMTAKLIILITIIDDIYDVYGTLDELELFTHAVDRWDINALKQLPDYMKICFLALFNSMNELVYDVLKDQDFNCIIYLKTMWAKVCESYLLEAKWCSMGHTPSLNEYLENAIIDITGPLMLVYIYICITNPIKDRALEDLVQLPALIRWTSLIARLTDDLGTSPDEMVRGDVAKSVQCYMHENDCSEEDARKYVNYLVGETWKKVNKESLMNRVYTKDFTRAALDYVRIFQCMYQHGDGHGVPRESKDRILSLIMKPIPLGHFSNLVL